MSRLVASIAGRYLRSRRSTRMVSLITFIATSGVTVGVMALIIVLGVMNGLQHDLREKILVASPHVRLLTYGGGLRMDDWREPLERVRRHPDVVAAAPFVIMQGLFSAGYDYSEGAYVLGIETDTGRAAVTTIAQTFVQGDLTFATTRDDVDGGIVLGRRLAERLSAFPGTVVTAAAPAGSKYNAAVGAIVPRYWTFEVTGYFETGMFEYDNAYTIMPLEQAQRFAGLDSAVAGIEIRLKDLDDAKAFGLRLEEELGYPYRALDWQTQNGQLFSALRLEKLVLGIILLLIVIVAAFNIVSTLTMVVTDKTREIGILRAMGFPARGIRQVFVLQGAVVGVVGTVIGAGLGLGLALLVDRTGVIRIDPSIYFVDRLPVQINPLDVVAVVTASVVVAVVATIYPARRAAVLDPVEAIRHE